MTHFRESLQLIYRSYRRFISLSFILASMVLMVRVYEFFVTSNISNYPPGSSVSILIGLKYDLILYLRISAILIIPFLLIAYFSQKAAKYFFIVLSVVLILTNMLMLQYFSTARVPLGADLLGYSIDEIKHTIETSGDLNLIPFILIVLYLTFMVRIFIKHVYIKVKPWFIVLLTVLMIGSFLPLKMLHQNPSKYTNEFRLFIATNKLNFFAESIANHYWQKGKINNQTYTFKKEVPSSSENPFTYIDSEFPFLHTETTPDVLGTYFELGETPPNFVFIIVESLGRAYVGEGAYLGSYTPFLDSLMEQSLYWENCLSTSGRTFEVLPSMLASVPFGDHGFAELDEKMPDHISLISLLKKQAGYNSSFVYGGEADFDNMDVFLKRQGITQIIDINKFGDGYSKLPATNNGFTWGYGDKDIFKRHLQEFKVKQEKPSIDVLLTIAMHDPFNIPDQNNYDQKFEKKLDQLELTSKIKLFNQQYKKQFASILYFDESIQFYFNEIKKLPSFSNTIFVITGDHRMPEIPISTQLDRFHVPLLIYSPLLKKPEKFSSVVTHFDITPSLIALLNGGNYISRPTAASWVGHGLDNSTDFRNINTYPLMRNKNEIMDIVNGENFWANGRLYQIYPNMDIEPIDNSEIQKQLKDELDNFIRKNNYVCRNNKLIPDSLKKWTFPGL